jgi:hypothetical protein
MSNIAEWQDRCNQINPDDVVAYLDGVWVTFRKRPPKRCPGWLEPHKIRLQDREIIVGWRLINNLKNGLTLARLHEVDEVQREFGGTLTRYDVAVDIPPTPGLKDFITRTVVMKWRRSQPSEDTEHVHYLNGISAKKQHNRNFVIYDDQPSKITGECEVVHPELRFRRRIIRTQGIDWAGELEHLNPRELFQRHIKLTDAGEVQGEAYIRDMMRKTAQRYRDRYRGREIPPYMDRYIANVPNIVRGTLLRLGFNRSQRMKDELGVEGNEYTLFPIPESLEWRNYRPMQRERIGGIGKKTPIEIIGFCSQKGAKCPLTTTLSRVNRV